jgi:hypothetical protein
LAVPSPKVLSYDDLRGIVDNFRNRYWSSNTIPIDVEHIADVELGLDIIAVPHLW